MHTFRTLFCFVQIWHRLIATLSFSGTKHFLPFRETNAHVNVHLTLTIFINHRMHTSTYSSFMYKLFPTIFIYIYNNMHLQHVVYNIYIYNAGSCQGRNCSSITMNNDSGNVIASHRSQGGLGKAQWNWKYDKPGLANDCDNSIANTCWSYHNYALSHRY